MGRTQHVQGSRRQFLTHKERIDEQTRSKMKIACVFLVLLVAVYTRADDPTVITAPGDVGPSGELVLSGFKSTGLACADSDGENVAALGCKSGSFQEVSVEDAATQYEWSIRLDCTGSKTISDCKKTGGPAAVTSCSSYVGCA